MIIKYILATFKKVKLSLIFPLVYMIPVVIIVFINVINNYGEIIQYYKFINNSNFNYIYVNQPLNEYSFFENNHILQGNYSERKSIAGKEFYDTMSPCSFYFYCSPNALDSSYFTEDNLMKGYYPDKATYEECIKQGVYPIVITYTAAKKLSVGLNDNVYYIYNYLNKNLADEEIRFTCKVVGIIYPDGKSSYESKVSKIKGSPISCAMISNELLEDIVKIKSNSKTPYIQFTDSQKDGDFISKTQILENIPVNGMSVFDLLFVMLVIFIINSFTLKILKMKFSKDTENLQKLGMRKRSLSLIYFMLSTTILLVTIIFAIIFIRYFYLPYIAMNYYDWSLITLVSILIFIIGSIYNAIFSVIRV